MGLVVHNSEELDRLAQFLSEGGFWEEWVNISADGVELIGTQTYELKHTLNLNRPIKLQGNGAVLKGAVPEAIAITSGQVKVENLILIGFPKAINIDAQAGVADGIELSGLTINDPGYGVCVNMGSSQNNGMIRNVHIHDCVMNSGYSDEVTQRTHFQDGAIGFNISAACPEGNRQEDICNTQIDGLVIEQCRILGGRRYGINMLVGVIIATEGIDFWSQKARVIDNAIRNVKVLDCEFDYCWEMGISLSCGCIMNHGSVLENLEVARCKVVCGIAGIGFSAAGPIVPTSISTDMGVRHGSIHDNYVKEMEMPINEPNFGIILQAGRSEGIGGVEVYRCFVEDVQIYNNIIEGSQYAIALVAANSLSDEPLELSDNFVRQIDIYRNAVRDCETAFFFAAAYAEGRRFDWNWGWRHVDQNWAPLLEEHHTTTCRYTGNYIEDIRCHDNEINGCRFELQATAARGRGHAIMKDNRLADGILYQNNKFMRSEGHVLVADVNQCDWIEDAGGNKVDESLRYSR